MKEIALIGSTGSIGKQVCSVVRRHPDKFRIVSIVANSSSEEFLKQVWEFKPKYAALANESVGAKIEKEMPAGVRFGYGKQKALDGASYGDVVVVAATGFAGLGYSLRAIEEKKALALANKETLVCGGELVMNKIKGAGTSLMPIDSEHSALWQALGFQLDAPFRRLILTASGGPFYGWDKERLSSVTPASALKHPTWQMGAKITIDSATLLNKGFEVIEAKWLYNCPLEKIHTVVQPESIIHSMVEYIDNSVIAQLSVPDMRHCVQYALELPERHHAVIPPLDLAKISKLTFADADEDTFIPLRLARESLSLGGAASAVLHSANEVAVTRFLEGKIKFTDIFDTLEYICAEMKQASNSTSLEEILNCVATAAQMADEYLARK